jgi:hypothetical protein
MSARLHLSAKARSRRALARAVGPMRSPRCVALPTLLATCLALAVLAGPAHGAGHTAGGRSLSGAPAHAQPHPFEVKHAVESQTHWAALCAPCVRLPLSPALAPRPAPRLWPGHQHLLPKCWALLRRCVTQIRVPGGELPAGCAGRRNAPFFSQPPPSHPARSTRCARLTRPCFSCARAKQPTRGHLLPARRVGRRRRRRPSRRCVSL